MLTSPIVRTLAIDTSTPRSGIALLDRDSAVLVRTFEPAQAAHAETLLGAIDELVREAGWAKPSIDLFACGIGPGSFTGVRVALATAKGMALALDRPIVGVSSLETMAWAFACHRAAARAAGAGAEEGGATAPGTDPMVALPLLDAKKDEVFGQPFSIGAAGPEASLAPLAPAAHFARSAMAEQVALAANATGAAGRDGVVWVLGAIAAGLDLGQGRLHLDRETAVPDPVALGRLARLRFRERGGDPLDLLEPIYVRPPDAVPNLPTDPTPRRTSASH